MMRRAILLGWPAALAAACLLAALAPAPAQAAEDKLKELVKTPGVIEIRLIGAQVPDLDPLPGQRESDVFVRVYLNNTKELLCETPIIQDDNSPKVSGRGQLCKLCNSRPGELSVLLLPLGRVIGGAPQVRVAGASANSKQVPPPPPD